MSVPLDAVRAALADEQAWVVGGAVRDRMLGRVVDDLDVALAGDPQAAARAVKALTGGAMFELSEAFGAWRVVASDQSWHVDLLPLRDGDLEADLAARDLTINAMAEPVAGGAVVDPHGGAADLSAGLLRAVGPRAFVDDPLRVVRMVRLGAELLFEVDAETLALARAAAGGLSGTAAERILAEFKRIVAVPAPRRGFDLMERAGVTEVVLPELLALRGVEQNVFHHLDVHDHTLAVLDAVAELEADPAVLGAHAADVADHLEAPLADSLTRWQALRFGALLHDVAKPATQGRRPDGRVTFIGHDAVGADVARAILRRLRASERLAGHVAALTLHHLRLGFLVHEQPLSRRSLHRYLVATDPVQVDVTVLSVADRLATRGLNAEPAIAAHVSLADAVLGEALSLHTAGPPAPLVRGDELARELGIKAGPEIGSILAQLEEDRFAGEVTTRADAIARARELLVGQRSRARFRGTP